MSNFSIFRERGGQRVEITFGGRRGQGDGGMGGTGGTWGRGASRGGAERRGGRFNCSVKSGR